MLKDVTDWPYANLYIYILQLLLSTFWGGHPRVKEQVCFMTLDNNLAVAQALFYL